MNLIFSSIIAALVLFAISATGNFDLEFDLIQKISFKRFFNLGYQGTRVQGPMFSDSFWDEYQNPYIVTGDVQIPKGYTLTIKAGTRVMFNGNYQILVKGAIRIEGSDPKTVNFVSNGTARAMIMFKSTDLSQSSIAYAHFYGPRTAIQLAEESEHNQDMVKNSGVLQVNYLALINSRIQTNGYETGASLYIINAYVMNSTIVGVYPRSESIMIKNAHIESSVIHSDSYNYGIEVETSTLIETKLMMGCCSAKIDVRDTSMNSVKVQEGSGSPVNGPFKMARCTADRLSVDLPSAEVYLASNRIRVMENQSIRVGTANMTCNTFIGDRTQTGITIEGLQGYYSSQELQQISKSTISNFRVGLHVRGKSTNLIVDQTNFIGNDAYNLYTESSRDIIAGNNYWGSSLISKADIKIYDYESNIDTGRVLIDPITSLRIDNHLC